MQRKFYFGQLLLLCSLPLYAQTHEHGHDHMKTGSISMPEEAGQGAFAAIQEIVELLHRDPDTDWSKVNIDVLREHLVDMHELTLHAKARRKNIADGVEIVIIGEGRTLQAIQTMVPAHARMLNGADEEIPWQAVAETIADGARLRVTSDDPKQISRIQALGFFGLMATGAHHQRHHLGIARGEMVH